jgi:hypothetical protein
MGTRKRLSLAAQTDYKAPATGVPWHLLFFICVPLAVVLAVWAGVMLRPPTDEELVKRDAESRAAAREAREREERALAAALEAKNEVARYKELLQAAQEERDNLKLKNDALTKKLESGGKAGASETAPGGKPEAKPESSTEPKIPDLEPDTKAAKPPAASPAAPEVKEPAGFEAKPRETATAAAAAPPRHQLAECKEMWTIEDAGGGMGGMVTSTSIRPLGNWKDTQSGVTAEFEVTEKRWSIDYKYVQKGAGRAKFKLMVMQTGISEPFKIIPTDLPSGANNWVKATGKFYLQVEAENCEFWVKATAHQ